MKKTYINPEVAIVKIQTMQMLAASDNLGVNEVVVSGDNAQGRRGYFDDEDEE